MSEGPDNCTDAARPGRVTVVISSRMRRGAEVFGHRLAHGLAGRGWWVNLVALTDDAVAEPVMATPLAPIDKAELRRLDWRVARGLRQAVASTQPDVVVAYGGPTLRYLAATLLLRRRRPQLVYVSIGEPKFWIRTALQKLVYGPILRRMDRCLAVTETTARQLVDHLAVPPGRVGVAPTGVPDDFFAASPRSAPTPATNFVVIGSLSEEKGPQVALDAFAAANSAGTARLRFVGDGPLRARLEQDAVARAVPGVEFVGSVADVRPHLQWATALLSTSQTEGLPGVVLEAAAAAVPSIAFNVGGTDEAVVDGTTGVLVAPGDVAGLTAALRTAIADPDQLRSQGEAALAMARDRFTVAAAVDRYHDELTTVVAPRPPTVAHLTTVDSSLRYLLFPQLAAVTAAGGRAVGISAPGPDVASLHEAGFEHVALHSSTRAFDPLQDLKAAAELWSAIRRVRPDVLHTHNPKPGLYGRVLGRLARVPIVVNTVHGLYATETDRWAKRAIVYGLEAIAARFSHAELSQSREDFELLRSRHIVAASKLGHLGNGISISRFDPDQAGAARAAKRAELGIADDEIVVGTVGRLVAEKGYPELFEAFASLGPGFRFIVVGPSDPSKADALPPELLDEAAGNGVLLLGLRDDVPELFAAMDIFVLASHREGFPRAAMEAAAMALPIVATDIRGCREVVTHGRNGTLIPVRDAAAIGVAISDLATDPEERERMGREGRKRALEEFDERRVVQRVMNTYRRVARHKGLRNIDRWLGTTPAPQISVAPDGSTLVATDEAGPVASATLRLADATASVAVAVTAPGMEHEAVIRLMRAAQEAAGERGATRLQVDMAPGEVSFGQTLAAIGYEIEGESRKGVRYVMALGDSP